MSTQIQPVNGTKEIEEQAKAIEKIMNAKAKRNLYYGIVIGIIICIIGFSLLMTFNHEILNFIRYLQIK
jgi:t-SNARE complex subunit (syntaxin)